MTWSTLGSQILTAIYHAAPVSSSSVLTMIISHSAGTVLVVPWGRGWQLFHSVSVWSNSCGVQTLTPVPGSALWWRLCAPSWACCSCLTYSSHLGTLKWKTEHFPATVESPKERGRKNKKGVEKKIGGCEGVDKLQRPIWNKNKMKARRLGVRITLCCEDLGVVFVVFNPSREFAPRYSIQWKLKLFSHTIVPD